MVIIRYIISATVIILCSRDYLFAQEKLPLEIEISLFKQVSICRGDSVTLLAESPITYWYEEGPGGNLRHVGKAFTVCPVQSTEYYVVSRDLSGNQLQQDTIDVEVSRCDSLQPARYSSEYFKIPPGALKLELSFTQSTAEFLLHGKEKWDGSIIRIYDARARLLQKEMLVDSNFRLSGRYENGICVVMVTAPNKKVYIGKLHLHD